MSGADRIVTPETWLELTSGEPAEASALDIDALRTRFEAVERIYCGSDTCTREFEAAVAAFTQLQQLGKPLTLAVPPLPQRLFPLFEDFLRSLGKESAEKRPPSSCQYKGRDGEAIQPVPDALEICVNDLGAFACAVALIRETGTADFCQVSIGRWLARQDTDPQLTAFCAKQQSESDHPQRLVRIKGKTKRLRYRPPGPALQYHWGTPSVFGASTLKVFRDLLGGDAAARPLRVELDQQPGLTPVPAGVAVSLHTEGALVSMLPCGDCANCLAAARLLGLDRNTTPLYQRRNAIIAGSPPKYM
ncbi:MAG: hypothetical protein FWD65_02255 [Coriobacteriia bacterium]|nr:hypothetical protein [Coriobacteriia bacterium]